jgi:hypothetical protein
LPDSSAAALGSIENASAQLRVLLSFAVVPDGSELTDADMLLRVKGKGILPAPYIIILPGACA